MAEARKVKSEDLPPSSKGFDVGHQSLPSYSPWTQFSGMPMHQNTQEQSGVFNWDALTPPSSPYDPPNTPYDTDLDSSQLNKDFLTNIQNLLSVNANPSPFQSDIRLPEVSQNGNLNMSDASHEGRDIYSDTFSSWNSFSQHYDPFGSSSVITRANNDSPDTTTQSSVDSLPINNNNKMSYSDVAKTLQSKPMQPSKEKEDVEVSKKKASGSFPAPKPFKPIVRKPYFTRQGSKGNLGKNHDDMESNVTPNSKYGLDQFDEFAVSQEQRSNSTESIPKVLSRKGSTSSVSSGTSGIEEIHLTKPVTIKADTMDDIKLPGKSAEPTQQPKPFFDARRIFQSKNSKKSSSSKPSQDSSTVLNNGKIGSKTSSSAQKKSTDNIYINNDLSDSIKRSNSQRKESESRKHDNCVQNGKVEKKVKSSADDSGSGKRKDNKRHLPLQSPFDQEYIDEWINFLFEKSKALVSLLWSGLITGLLLLFGLIAYLVSNSVHYVIWSWGKVSHFVKTRILNKYFKGLFKDSAADRIKLGLGENIVLPATGSEAMQRLLACKGKDPYSILGLRCDCSDDDIRKYYRKQAILVHPDKNKQPGAEEAFKILGRAFKLIGSTDLRQKYDTEFKQADEAEAAMKEFNDLLTKLQDKMQEAANMMRCDNCGGKHRRVYIDRPWYSARFCKRCNVLHSAKEGDVWAETTMFGFLWHYYACMEGKIYDITEWVACKKDFFKHMQASAHHVFYRIATEGNRTGGGQQGRTGEADLEDFINNLFQQAMHTDGNSQWQPPQPPPPQPNQQSKKTRRRKKKH